MYSQAHIERLYAQGPNALLRLVRKLEGQIDDLSAQLIRQPQPVINRLMQDLRRTQQNLQLRQDELRQTHQLNHQLRQRVRQLELALE